MACDATLSSLDVLFAVEKEKTFSCRTENAKNLTNVLLRLCNYNVKKDQICYVEVSLDAIVFQITGILN